MKYAFVGYGSLMSHKSLKQTISNKKFKPAIIKDYKRIFNLNEYKTKDPDILNVKKSKKAFFNGVLFYVDEKELKRVKKRESEYELESVYAYDFRTGKRLCKCFIVIDHYLFIDHNKKSPNKNYFKLCREAAYHISRKFGKMWDDTTYVSNCEKVSEWIKNNENYNTINYSSTFSTFIA